MNKKEDLFANKRILICGKGGSGKSTITILLAEYFMNCNYQVCVLDADSTNTGIYQMMGFKKPPVSLINYFGDTVFVGGKVSCPVDDPRFLPGAEISLNKIPNKYYSSNNKNLFLFQLGKIGDKGPGAGCDGPISKIARDLRINQIGPRPITLIDVKAGLEDSARGVITSMDLVIAIVEPNITSIQIAEDVKNLVSLIKEGGLPATEHLKDSKLVEQANKIYKEAKIKKSFTLLNKVDSKNTENYLRKELSKKGIEPIGVIHEDSLIPTSWLKGSPLKSTESKKDIINAIEEIKKFI